MKRTSSDTFDDPSSSSEDESSAQFCFFGWRDTSRTKKAKNPTEGEQQLTDDLNKLSIDERNAVYEEIHGILPGSAVQIEQDATTVDQLIAELQNALARKAKRPSSVSEMKGYDIAAFLSPQYVQDPRRLLMFLRAEQFDAKSASERLLRFFNLKLHLFGVENLVKRITWNDLDEEAQQSVLTGAFQLHPDFKDSVGRYIIIWVASVAHDTVREWDTNIKAVFYIVMGFIEQHESAQKDGLVSIAYNIGLDERKSSPENVRKSTIMINALPIRSGAFHMCHDNPKIKFLVSLLQMLLGYQTRIRFRGHFGTHMECRYQLMSFGMNSRTFPVTSDGDILTEQFLAYIDRRRMWEEETERRTTENCPDGWVPYPTSNDVLFGRGRAQKMLPGMIRLQALIQSFLGRYMSSSKDEKTVIAETVVMMIKEKGGRFLKRTRVAQRQVWTCMEDMASRERVSQTFRVRIREGKA